MARIVVALIFAGALAGAAGASPANPPTFVRGVMTQLTAGSPEAAWKFLHPAHQKVAPRGQFARCVRVMRGGSTARTKVTVASWREVRINRREIPQQSGWSVRVVVTRHEGGVTLRENRGLEVVQVGSRLRWLLTRSTYDAYRHAPNSTFCPT
ncbi:MAG: hypothetical protein E6G45_10975 [Actinobacteria bacterium]|nr:MAG: hypothetical protein E6G45_10975 [Actinomycetota bacterium]